MFEPEVEVDGRHGCGVVEGHLADELVDRGVALHRAELAVEAEQLLGLLGATWNKKKREGDLARKWV